MSHPARAVLREQSAPVAPPQSPFGSKGARGADELEELTSRDGDPLPVAQLLKHYRFRFRAQLIEELGEKSHGVKLDNLPFPAAPNSRGGPLRIRLGLASAAAGKAPASPSAGPKNRCAASRAIRHRTRAERASPA
jgi:hypothetical protein